MMYRKRSSEHGTAEEEKSTVISPLIIRHAGVLGISAIIRAFPYSYVCLFFVC